MVDGPRAHPLLCFASMIWLIYNALFLVGFTLMLPRFLWRMAKRGGYAKDFAQRFGRYEPELAVKLSEGGRVWVHAVSVGEVFIALRLAREWRGREPAVRFVISTTTSTGYALLRQHVKAPDVFMYFPTDFPWVPNKVLSIIRPRALVLVELELWPNLVRAAHERGVPVLLVNGRVSERSFRGYMRLRAFTSRILPMLRALCAQSEGDADRLKALGAPTDRVVVLGSAKYDVAQPDAAGESAARHLLRVAGIASQRRILLGGSTWPGEELALARIFKKLRAAHPDLALVIAPRHVERAADAVEDIQGVGLSVVLRSQGAVAEGYRPDAFVLDSTGELKNFYPCADVIFIGKSLMAEGGQNVIEPALFGKPVVVGPNMQNFRQVMDDFRASNAIVQVQDVRELESEVARLLRDKSAAAALGANAARLVKTQSGAMGRTLDRIIPLVAQPPS